MGKRAVWKYEVGPLAETEFEIPKDATILRVGNQGGLGCIWMLVDTTQPKVKRKFVSVGTGQKFDNTGLNYIGTWENGPFVWHLFEVMSK